MKWFLVIGLVLTCLISCGCLSSQDQTRIDHLTAKVFAYEKEVEELEAKIKDGSLSVADGMALISTIRKDATLIRDELADIKSRNSTGEVVVGILQSLLTVGLSLGGVRVWRGSVNARNGDIGKT